MKFKNVEEMLKYVYYNLMEDPFTPKKFSDVEYQKIIDFLKKIPQDINRARVEYGNVEGIGHSRVHTFYFIDFDEKWGTEAYICRQENGDVTFEILPKTMLRHNPKRPDSNKEAVELMKAYNEVKTANDIDPYWEMSDDWNTHRWGSKRNDEARAEKREIAFKLAYSYVYPDVRISYEEGNLYDANFGTFANKDS